MSNKIMKEKYDSTITIVTAFFDIGRGNLQSKEELPDYMTRTNDTYFEYFSNLATLDNPMVIFSDNEHIEKMLFVVLRSLLQRSKFREMIQIKYRSDKSYQ